MVRLDKFLKLSRLVKRRTLAAQLADAGAVRVNGRTAKPSSSVKEGDEVAIAFPFRLVVAKVLIDDEAVLRRPKVEGAEVVSERRLDPEENPWQED